MCIHICIHSYIVYHFYSNKKLDVQHVSSIKLLAVVIREASICIKIGEQTLLILQLIKIHLTLSRRCQPFSHDSNEWKKIKTSEARRSFQSFVTNDFLRIDYSTIAMIRLWASKDIKEPSLSLSLSNCIVGKDKKW